MSVTTHTASQCRPSPPNASNVRRNLMLGMAAGVPALLYLLYVFHYSVNTPWSDDWNMIPNVDSALHGHLSMRALWRQYTGTRLLIGRLVFVAFGFIDHLNEQSIVLFSAVTFVATYFLFLSLVRSYVGRKLAILPVFVLGVVWFSLVDEQNALWSFQVSWYLAVFFFIAMVYLLLIPQSHRNLLFGLGIVAAVAGSLSEVFGFALWPVGLICLLWAKPWLRRTYYESAIWVGAAAITTAIYLPGYNAVLDGCTAPSGSPCSLSFGLRNPDQLVRFFLLLVTSVIPTSSLNWNTPPSYFGALELLGVGIVLAAGFVVVQSIRARQRQDNASPLPVLLIAFAVLVDLMFALSRVGEGLQVALKDNRYTMPNVILLVGIVAYAWTNTPNLRKLGRPIDWYGWVRILGVATLVILLIAQVILSTKSGIANGRVMRQTEEADARVVVNLARIPVTRRGCDVSFAVYNGVPTPSEALHFIAVPRRLALQDRLSVFEPSTNHALRSEGSPNIVLCHNITRSLLPDGTIGAPYSATLDAGGGKPPYKWSLDPYHPGIWILGRPNDFDVLPNGLTLTSSTGAISGLPKVRGAFTFYAKVRSTRSSYTITRIFSITIL